MKTEALQNFDCCLTSLAAYMKSNPADCYQQDIWYSWESLQYQADLLSSTGRSAEVLPNFDKWINTVRLLVPNSMLWAGASSKKAKWLSRLPTNSDKAFSLYEHIDDAIHSKEFQANLSSNLQQQSKMFVADTWLERTYLYTRRCEFQSALKAADKAKLCIDAVPNNEWASLKLAVLYQNYATINFRLGQNKTGYMYLLKSEDLLKSIPNDKTWKTELLECLSAQCRDMGKFADALRIDEYASDVGVGPMRKAHFLRHACNDAVLLGKNDLALQYGMKAIDSIDQLIESDSAWLKSGESIVFYDCFKMLSDLLIKENRTKDAEQLIHKWAEKVHKRAAKKFIDFVMYRVEARCLCRIASAKESALRAIDGELALMADPLFRDQLVWVNYFNLKWDTQMDREAVFSEYKMYPEAIAAARAALESLDNTSPEYRPDQRMESFLWMGKDYVKMGDYKEARNCFKTLEDSWNALGIEKYKIERIERIHIESLLYRDMQDYSEQKRVLELCIESKKKFYGVPVFPGHIDLNQEMEAALTKLARS
jgi:tetratricopeptide (TPR) repeat protein